MKAVAEPARRELVARELCKRQLRILLQRIDEQGAGFVGGELCRRRYGRRLEALESGKPPGFSAERLLDELERFANERRLSWP